MSNISDYVLVIPSWYPSKVNSFNGDFNKRLVNAVTQHHKQIILYVTASSEVKKIEVEITREYNVSTIIVYHPISDNQFLNKFIKVYYYLRLNYKYILRILQDYGKPKLIHCYVFFPAGLVAVFLKSRFNIKVILTEHWTSFYKEDPQYLKNHSFISKVVYKYVLNSFSAILPVAEKLGDAINEWTKKVNQIVIPNVVDTNVFFYDKSIVKTEEFTFLHVSTMGYQKNIESILEVFEGVLEKDLPVKLCLIGPLSKNLREKIRDSDYLRRNVEYLGEVDYREVAYWMKKSDAFILFSRFENLPCVILEALCCGLPVISTNVGGIAEVINKSNGLLIESEDKAALKKSIVDMVSGINDYNKQIISEKAIASFSYEVVASKINAIYKRYK